VNPTEDQLAFFESRVRPVLVNHCYECHSKDAEEIGGNLLLDSRAGLFKGGDTEPPVIPLDADMSLLITAVRQSNPDLTMPPEGKLSDQEIADLEAWVQMGAPDPRTEDTVAAVKARNSIDWDKARDFWSLKPISSPPVPAVQQQDWPAGDLGRFILARLETAGVAPTDDADKTTLLRRATYDLIGLPPTPDEIDAFLADSSPEAFEKVIDRLLDSPQYGERWGRYWLDVVRYSDTAGDNSDFPIPQMYLYRNWVIDAFNADKPYDQFVREQLAGDLMGGDSPEQTKSRLIATGYIANARRFGSRVSDYPQHLTIEDTIDNLGRTFLATTINCARCHNHKFDPITAEDYYALYGIFNSTRYPWPGIELEQKQRDLVPLVSKEEAERAQHEHQAKQEELNAEVQRLEKERDAAEGDNRKELDKRVEEARRLAEEHNATPLPYEQAYAVAEASLIEDAAVQLKGDPAKPGEVVRRHFLTVLNGEELSPGDPTSGRLQLAEWIVDRANPLTARVIANRVWLYHFGRGIVATPNDFGRQGKAPTHPELLDWLATKFMDSGWSIKSLHREIMLSRTYRLSSHRSEIAVERDPTNQWFGSFPRRRLDAEALRDTLLVLGGNLDVTPGGPHPFPPQTEWKFTQHHPFKAIYDTNRRSVYLMTQRIQRHPYLAIFDGADPSASTPVRLVSTTPLQALYLLNDPFVHEQSRQFAARLLKEGPDDSSRMERAWRLSLGRAPDAEEKQSGLAFLVSTRQALAESGVPDDQQDVQTWQALVRVLFRLNEFIYLD
jgi:hypothetical protein